MDYSHIYSQLIERGQTRQHGKRSLTGIDLPVTLQHMNNTKYTIYWMSEGHPHSCYTYNMTEALSTLEDLRKDPTYSSVAFCSENVDQVGKPGVDAVVNGMLPDGLEYVYKTGRDRGRDPR